MKDLLPVIKQAIRESIANDLESIKSSIEELKNLDESVNQSQYNKGQFKNNNLFLNTWRTKIVKIT